MIARDAVVLFAITLAVGQYAGGQNPTPSLLTINQLLTRRDFNGALAMSTALLRNQPKSPQLWLARAVSLRELGSTKDSLAAFKHVLTLEPNNVAALEGASEAAFLIKDPAARPLIQKLLELTPTDPVVNAMAGSLAYERGDCHAAIKYLTDGTLEVQSNKTASLQLSHCLLIEGKPTEAVTVLEALPRRDEDDLTSYDLAFALFSAGRFEESAARLATLSAKHAGGAEVLDLLGAAYGKLDRVQDALDAYRSACDEAPTVPGYYIDLAMFAMEHSSEIAAIQVLNTAIQRIPNSSALLTFRGAILSFLGEPEKAEKDFMTAEKVDPSSGFGRVGRSLSLRDQGKSAEAEAQLRQELKKSPKNVKAKYFLAEMLVDSNTPSSLKEAQHLLEDVMKERPDDPNALLALSKTLMENRDPKAALPLLLHARRLDPKSASVLNRLLQDYRALGLKADAIEVANALRQTIDENRNAEARRNRFHITAVAQ